MQIAIFIVMFIVFAIAGIVLFVVYNKYLKPENSHAIQSVHTGVSVGDTDMSTDTKSYLTFKELCEESINLGMYQYRAIIECSSISYGLRTPQERDMIEYGFQGFLNSLDYPVVFYVQTRCMDISEAIRRMRERGEAAIKVHPNLKGYIDENIANMEQISRISGVPRCKKKYLILSYDLESDLSNLTEEEKEQFCREELANRVSFCRQNLQSIGIKTKVLKKEDIAACLYAAFNRNEYFLVADIIKGQLNRLSIAGDNLAESMDIPAQIATLLFQTRNSIDLSLHGLDDNDIDTRKLYKGVCDVLDILTREINSGHDYGMNIVDYITQLGLEIESKRRSM